MLLFYILYEYQKQENSELKHMIENLSRDISIL